VKRRILIPLGVPAGQDRRRAIPVTSILRVLGAVLLLGVGLDHIEQYYGGSYSVVPTIGTLFALNFVSATLVAAALLLPARRLTGRWAHPLQLLLAASGVAIAAGSLAGLLVSENGGLFGFAEQGYRPAIVLSMVLEVATIVTLGAFLAAQTGGARQRVSPAGSSA
jgi:hypothetical protein